MRLFLFLCVFSSSVFSQQVAQDLFSQFQPALYQIRIIEIQSGKKSSIGSGFQIDQKGNIITNYHVVAQYVNSPEQFRIEYLNHEGGTQALALKQFDVISDLALLKTTEDVTHNSYFNIAQTVPEQGVQTYSLGNPHDLGMIVVPGTYNGIKAASFYSRVHFTGSINSGMSGGPVVNANGLVIGVNVATAGNQIGFLVPLNKIKALAAKTSQDPVTPEQFKQEMGKQLTANQQELIDALLEKPWPSVELGDALVPDKVAPFMSCWGGSNADNPKSVHLSIENRCRLSEDIFLSHHLTTGSIEMEFEWVTTEKLSDMRFYNMISTAISRTRPANKAGEKAVTHYQCTQNKVNNQHSLLNQSTLCFRAYKDFEDLYDVLYIGASIQAQQSSLISHFTLAGVSKASALKFSKHFMEALTWR